MTATASRSQLGLVMAISFSFFLAMSMISPVFPLFVVGLGASKLELGLLMSFFSLVTIVTRLPFSALVKRLGAWTLLPVALAMEALAYSLYYLATRPLLLFPIAALHAMSWSILGPTALVVASDVAPADRVGGTMGKYFTAVALSFFSGPIVGGVLMRFVSIRQAILFAVLFPTSGLVTILLFRGITKTPHIDPENGLPGSEASSAPLAESLRRVLGNRNVIILFSSGVVFSMATAMMTTLFPLYAQETLLLSVSTISLLYSARGATNMLVRLPTGKFSDKIGRKPLFLLAFGLAFLAFLLFSKAEGLVLTAIAMAVFGIAWGMRLPPSTAMLNESVSVEDRGPALALHLTTVDLGMSIGSYIAGATAERLETPRLFFFSAISICPILFLIALGLRETLEKGRD